MSNAPVRGIDAISLQILGNAQMQGSRSQSKDGNGADALGEFGKLIEKATDVLEAARTANNAGIGMTAPKADAGMDFTPAAQSTDRQVKPADQKDGAKPETNTGNRAQEAQNQDQDNARVTDDKAEKDLRGAADDAGRKIVSEVAEKLDVDEADVEAAMETLGLSAMQLLDPANLTALLTELTGESDPMAIVTDADLYQNLQDLIQMARELSEEIGVTPEDVNRMATAPEDVDFAPLMENAEEASLNGSVNEEEEPVRVHMTETNAEGEAVDVQVTMEGGNVVRTQASESDQPEENKERGNRNRGEAAQPVKTEDIVGQIANHMVENAADFNDTIPVEQVAGARQQEMVEIVRQITEQIRVNISSDVTSMELTLHPASLGNVQLTVLQDATGKLVAQFAVENETVRQAIEGQMSQLQQRLDEQGVKIEAVEVTLASHGFESSMNGQNTGQQADEQRDEQVRAAGPRGRRSINLDDLDPAEELEEEARIAAEMMAANGNTVDYTA